MDVFDAHRIKGLESKNAKLKRLVAEQMLVTDRQGVGFEKSIATTPSARRGSGIILVGEISQGKSMTPHEPQLCACRALR